MQKKYDDDKAERIVEVLDRLRINWVVSEEYQTVLRVALHNRPEVFIFGNANKTLGAQVYNTADEMEAGQPVKDLESKMDCDEASPEELAAQIIRMIEDFIVTRRIEEAVCQAEIVFWEKIVDMFPESKSGDLSPLATHNMGEAITAAVTEWVYYNCEF